ncbi:MAG TPA: methyltransferase domain-containing protein [Chthonomonadaceae bacterium]|nr:methyltransferase domain-containing protein [Chthonomonadaceae bacterium]
MRACEAGDGASPFDQMAVEYDLLFTYSRIGTLLRQAVWRRLDVRFLPGDRILELNCGTGEDALHLAQRGVQVLATDVSAEMVLLARQKIRQAGMAANVEVRRMAIEEISDPFSALQLMAQNEHAAFDGALSDFGGLNCARNLPQVAEGLAACLRPGAVALLCIMGPLCPWEWGWYLLHGQPGKAFRRLRRGGVPWRGLTITYPSIRAVCHAFAPHFRPLRVGAIGALLPPTYAEGWAARHEGLLARLDRWERRLETLPPFPLLADHYLLELERKPGRVLPSRSSPP